VSPTVARVLPVALWRQRETLDYESLEQAATQRDERQALGGGQGPRAARITVLVPERHDLALMKTVRADQADFAKLQAIPNAAFFPPTLTQRGPGATTPEPKALSSSRLGNWGWR
jgi:hypothetical protein